MEFGRGDQLTLDNEIYYTSYNKRIAQWWCSSPEDSTGSYTVGGHEWVRKTYFGLDSASDRHRLSPIFYLAFLNFFINNVWTTPYVYFLSGTSEHQNLLCWIHSTNSSVVHNIEVGRIYIVKSDSWATWEAVTTPKVPRAWMHNSQTNLGDVNACLL